MDENQQQNQSQPPLQPPVPPQQGQFQPQVSPISPSNLPILDPDFSQTAHDLGISDQLVNKLQTQINTMPPEANDVDLIEKEWVLHLEHVVAKTSEDPYLQQAEISRIKADYLKKRYNKTIKLSDTQA